MGIVQHKPSVADPTILVKIRRTTLSTEETTALIQQTVLQRITSDLFPLISSYCKRKGVIKEHYEHKLTISGHFTSPTTVCVWEDKLVIADQSSHSVQIFDAQGTRLSVIGPAITCEDGTEASLSGPIGVALTSHGTIVVAENFSNKVRFFTPQGQCLKTLGDFSLPYDVATDDHGLVYIADSGNGRIQVLNQDYEVVRSITTRTGFKPYGIRVDPTNRNLVCVEHSRIRVFSHEGTLLKTISEPGKQPGQMSGCFSVEVDGEGTILLPDAGNQRLQIFTQDGQFVRCFGDPPRLDDTREDVFGSPVTCAITPEGNLYISDIGNSRIVMWG